MIPSVSAELCILPKIRGADIVSLLAALTRAVAGGTSQSSASPLLNDSQSIYHWYGNLEFRNGRHKTPCVANPMHSIISPGTPKQNPNAFRLEGDVPSTRYRQNVLIGARRLLLLLYMVAARI